MSGDIHCCKCDFKTGHPNQEDGTFICSGCESGYDYADEKAEARYMGVQ